MKKLFAAILLTLLFSSVGYAQFAGASNGTSTAVGVIAGSQINVLNSGATTSSLTVTVLGAPATINVQIESSTNNGSTYSVCGQTITVTSGTVSTTCTGVFDHVQVDITTLTGGTNPSVVWGLTASQPVGGELDPCKNSGVAEVSFPVTQSAAGTFLVVPAITNAKVTGCGWVLIVTGTNPTVLFEYGTQATNPCDTGATALTPAFAVQTGVPFSFGGSGATVLKTTPPSQQLCIVLGGTVTAAQILVVAVRL